MLSEAAKRHEDSNPTKQFDQENMWTTVNPRYMKAHSWDNSQNRSQKYGAAMGHCEGTTFSKNPEFGGCTTIKQYHPNGTKIAVFANGETLSEFNNQKSVLVAGASVTSASGGGSYTFQGTYQNCNSQRNNTTRRSAGAEYAVYVGQEPVDNGCSDGARSRMCGASNGFVVPGTSGLSAQALNLEGKSAAMLTSGDGPVAVCGAGQACVVSSGGGVSLNANGGTLAGKGFQGVVLGAGAGSPYVCLYTQVPGVLQFYCSSTAFQTIAPGNIVMQNDRIDFNPGRGGKNKTAESSVSPRAVGYVSTR